MQKLGLYFCKLLKSLRWIAISHIVHWWEVCDPSTYQRKGEWNVRDEAILIMGGRCVVVEWVLVWVLLVWSNMHAKNGLGREDTAAALAVLLYATIIIFTQLCC